MIRTSWIFRHRTGFLLAIAGVVAVVVVLLVYNSRRAPAWARDYVALLGLDKLAVATKIGVPVAQWNVLEDSRSPASSSRPAFDVLTAWVRSDGTGDSKPVVLHFYNSRLYEIRVVEGSTTDSVANYRQLTKPLGKAEVRRVGMGGKLVRWVEVDGQVQSFEVIDTRTEGEMMKWIERFS